MGWAVVVGFMQVTKLMSLEREERHLGVYTDALRVTVRRLENPPVEKSWMTDEQRKAFNQKVLRGLRSKIRRLQRVLNP